MTNNTTHEEISLLLPWYLNGTLDTEEKALVTEHIHECEECSSEIIGLEVIREAVMETNELVDKEISAEFENMEESIMQRIEETDTDVSYARDEETETIWSSIKNLMPAISLPTAIPAGAMAILLVQFGLIALLAGKLYFGTPEETNDYKVLSGDTELVQTAGPKLLVVFQEDASIEAIGEVLEEIRGKIVDGPKAGGLYVIELEPDEQAADTIQELSANTEIIKSATEGY